MTIRSERIEFSPNAFLPSTPKAFSPRRCRHTFFLRSAKLFVACFHRLIRIAIFHSRVQPSGSGK